VPRHEQIRGWINTAADKKSGALATIARRLGLASESLRPALPGISE